MFKISSLVASPLFACLAVAISIVLPAPEPVSARESERELRSWTIVYDGGWTGSTEDGLAPRGAVNSVTMRRNGESYDIFFHYTSCNMCAAMDRRASYFTVDQEKAQQIAALVDEDQVKTALERPCTLPLAKARLNKVSVTLDPPPTGYAPFSYDILLGCQSPQLDEVRANLDAAIRLFSVWMQEHESHSKQ